LCRLALAAGALSAAARHSEQALLLARQQRPAGDDLDGLFCTRDALLLVAETWRARGSYADAHKYLAAALALSERSRLPLLVFESRLAMLRLQVCCGLYTILPSPILHRVWHEKGGSVGEEDFAQWSCNNVAIG